MLHQAKHHVLLLEYREASILLPRERPGEALRAEFPATSVIPLSPLSTPIWRRCSLWDAQPGKRIWEGSGCAKRESGGEQTGNPTNAPAHNPSYPACHAHASSTADTAQKPVW